MKNLETKNPHKLEQSSQVKISPSYRSNSQNKTEPAIFIEHVQIFFSLNKMNETLFSSYSV